MKPANFVTPEPDLPRINTGLSEPSDLPADTAPRDSSPALASAVTEPAASQTPPPLGPEIAVALAPRGSLLEFVQAYIGHEGVGDPIPALVHAWRRQTDLDIDPQWWPGLWNGPQRVDIPQPGDLVRFQYQRSFERYWHGVVAEVHDAVATVILAQSLRDDAETELRLEAIEFRAMRGWQLNNAWPVVAFVRL
jgi:hypothetical protein